MTKKNLTILLGFFVFAIFGVLFALVSLIFGGPGATVIDLKEAASKLGKEGGKKKKEEKKEEEPKKEEKKEEEPKKEEEKKEEKTA